MDNAILNSDKIELMINALGGYNSLFHSDKKFSPGKHSVLECFYL